MTGAAVNIARDARHLSLVTSAAGLAALGGQWRALEASATNPLAVFQSHVWLSGWAKTYRGASPVIVTGHRGRDLVFAWPLMVARAGPVKLLRWLSHPFAQYGDILLSEGEDASGWLGAAEAYLAGAGVADVLHLRYLRHDAAIRGHADVHFKNARTDERAGFLDLTQFANEAAYDARYDSSQRKRRKKIRKALEQRGEVTFRRLSAGEELDRAIDRAFDEKCAWLKDRARQNRIMGCPGHREFLKRLSRQTGEFELVVTELAAGGDPVSWELGFRYRSRHFAYITSHVNALTDLSPGRLHMDQSQRLALKDGLKAFDLMIPYDAHKESWSSGFADTSDYYHPLTPVGRLYGLTYLETTRPVLRRAYYTMPQGARRVVKPLFGL
jgi:CelD/BcsL family acetyltransferase involved in cellulose biosynthesis